jgi:hypothetical protein
MTSKLSRQFSAPQGSAEDKAALVSQLSKSFHPRDLEWLQDPHVKVEKRPVAPNQIDWDHREEWQATREPGKVKDKRKDIKHGDMKPVAFVDRPHSDNLMVMDGHHHAEAYTQLMGKPRNDQPKSVRNMTGMPGYVIHVNKTNGPWDTLHNRQEHNKNA